MDYETIDNNLLLSFPELSPAHQKLLDEWEGDKLGQYILFEDLFAHYIEHLFAAQSSSVRDKKLQSIFEFIDSMIADHGEVQNLAYIAMFEHRSYAWYQAAKPFMGPYALAELNKYLPEWSRHLTGPDQYVVTGHDLYGVAEVVQRVLNGDVVL